MSGRRSRIAALCTLGCALLLSSPVNATQPVSVDALAGAWVFEADPHNVTRCVIRGQVEATRAGAGLDMTMRVHETCPDGDQWRAEEACTARLVQGVLTVRCTVVSATPDNYVADQFSLRVLAATLMTGRLADGVNWDSPVRWRRPAPALVS